MSKKSKKALKKEQRRMEEAERLFLLSEISRVQTRLETKLKFLFNFLMDCMDGEEDEGCHVADAGCSRCRPAV